MKNSALILVTLVAVILAGCASEPVADTNPLPAEDPQTKLKKQEEAIANSDMTPEQKQKALEYARQGAAQSDAVKASAEAAGAKTEGY